MSDQARDDLVAAMEALRILDETPGNPDAFAIFFEGVDELIRKHGPALLAMLDAEPVMSVTINAVGCHFSPSRVDMYKLPPGKYALYARPEASDE